VDQLNAEKSGVPTVTIATDAFLELAETTMSDNGISEMALVVVEHPIAGHKLDAIREKAEKAFPDILRAATEWQQPSA